MFLDGQTLFSDAQALAASGVGTNVIDLSQDRSIGTGEGMVVMFQVDVAADRTTLDENYTFDVEYASNAAQSAGRQLIGRRVFESTPTAPAQNSSLLAAGFIFYIPIPPTQLSESEQFLGIRYVLAGTTPSVTVTAALIPAKLVQEYVSHPKGYTIS